MEVNRTFRPTSIGHLFGQEHVLNMLVSWVERPETIPSTIMFSGPYGTGKTSIARILSGILTNGSTCDIDEINAAASRGIDDVREIADSVRIRPFGPAKVYILDEFHQLTDAAQKALLKVVEEPPQGVYFFFCTTEPSKIVPMLRSRCFPVEMKLLTRESTQELLSFLTKGRITEEFAEAIYFRSGGHARDAVKLAEASLSAGISTVEQLEQAVQGTDYQTARHLLAQLIGGVRPATADLLKVAQMSDDRALAELLDSTIDQAAFAGHEKALRYYPEFLTMRAYRKEYKITPREQAIHLISRFIHE
jgi:DNA polymerase-3 subunit gamma/tau